MYTCARVGTYIRISVLNVRVYHICTAKLIYPTRQARAYGVATISSLLKITGLFCKRALYKRRYSAKETYNFKEPTNRSHPIMGQSVSIVYFVYVFFLCVFVINVAKSVV